LNADDSGRFEGSLLGNSQGLKWWYPVSVLPADCARLQTEYSALPGGDTFEPDGELAVLRPDDVDWSLFGIDFDNGKMMRVPKEIAGKPEDDIKSLHNKEGLNRWARENGVDALARFTTNEFEFAFFDMPTHLLYLTDGWQSLKPDRIKRALVSGKLPGSGRFGDKLTNYFDNSGVAVAFRTRENRLGAWRMAGKVGDPLNPRGVKVRYKLVQRMPDTGTQDPQPGSRSQSTQIPSSMSLSAGGKVVVDTKGVTLTADRVEFFGTNTMKATNVRMTSTNNTPVH